MRTRLRLVAPQVLLAVVAHSLAAQQVSDTLFQPRVGIQAYPKGAGPAVLIDEAHVNFHTVEGRYLTFARLLRNDGYVVSANRVPFSRASLARAKVLVIANALNRRNESRWELPTPSAFTIAEVAAVKSWVAGGGSLLLIADHMPFPGAAAELAAAFGVALTNGFVTDSISGEGNLGFTRATGLADHVITRGRTPSERIDSIVAFTGEAFRLTGPGSALITFGPHTTNFYPRESFEVKPDTRREPARGMLQGAAIEFGAGRVAVFGEAAMFSAQLGGPDHDRIGMNAPNAPQNAQFALNVVHWLSKLL
ncbi:MAG: DUF4350 domain-containing protein [Gemmatimonadota bacterium]